MPVTLDSDQGEEEFGRELQSADQTAFVQRGGETVAFMMQRSGGSAFIDVFDKIWYGAGSGLRPLKNQYLARNRFATSFDPASAQFAEVGARNVFYDFRSGSTVVPFVSGSTLVGAGSIGDPSESKVDFQQVQMDCVAPGFAYSTVNGRVYSAYISPESGDENVDEIEKTWTAAYWNGLSGGSRLDFGSGFGNGNPVQTWSCDVIHENWGNQTDFYPAEEGLTDDDEMNWDLIDLAWACEDDAELLGDREMLYLLMLWEFEIGLTGVVGNTVIRVDFEDGNILPETARRMTTRWEPIASDIYKGFAFDPSTGQWVVLYEDGDLVFGSVHSDANTQPRIGRMSTRIGSTSEGRVRFPFHNVGFVLPPRGFEWQLILSSTVGLAGISCVVYCWFWYVCLRDVWMPPTERERQKDMMRTEKLAYDPAGAVSVNAAEDGLAAAAAQGIVPHVPFDHGGAVVMNAELDHGGAGVIGGGGGGGGSRRKAGKKNGGSQGSRRSGGGSRRGGGGGRGGGSQGSRRRSGGSRRSGGGSRRGQQ